jgi:hypothetical protein
MFSRMIVVVLSMTMWFCCYYAQAYDSSQDHGRDRTDQHPLHLQQPYIFNQNVLD